MNTSGRGVGDGGTRSAEPGGSVGAARGMRHGESGVDATHGGDAAATEVCGGACAGGLVPMHPVVDRLGGL